MKHCKECNKELVFNAENKEQESCEICCICEDWICWDCAEIHDGKTYCQDCALKYIEGANYEF